MTAPYQNANAKSCPPVVPSGDDSEPSAPGYLSAAAIAKFELPGLPATKRRVNAMAAREGWVYRARAGHGGGRLYAITSLPQAAQDALHARRIASARASARAPGRPAGSDWFAHSPDIAAAVDNLAIERGLAAPLVMELLTDLFPRLPSLRTLQRRIARIQHEKQALIASVRSPDDYRAKHRLALGRADRNVTYANEIWELDTTPADVMTTGGRKAVLGLIDRWSRRANLMVDESESGQSVRRLLVETITAWGVMPAAVMTDNGSGYINRSIRSALEALGIEHIVNPPGKPECKPHVERLFGTFTRQRAELLEGYIGHNVAEAQQLRARARSKTGRLEIVAGMTPEELQAVMTAWLDGVYHSREHGGIRMTPMAKWLSSPVPSMAAPDKTVLRLALSALVGTRRVGKRGIVWKQGRYWAPALAAWIARDVIVRRDEDDLGRLLIFAPDGSFIDVAVDHSRSGLSEAEFARAAQRDQAALISAQRAELRERAKAFDYTKARDALLRRDAEAAGKLAYLPRPTVTPSTPTIDSLTRAVNDQAEPPALELRTPPAPVVIPMPRSPDQRVREADALIARAEAGELVDADELRRARLYQTTSEYRAHRAVIDHFSPPSTDQHAG